MIAKALDLLVKELNQYIDSFEVGAGPSVVEPNHIALAENMSQNDAGTLEKVVLSLVNVEEEKRLKNTERVTRVGDEARTGNPPITLNLYLLFSASFEQYPVALHRLSQVIEFFQGKFVFTLSNSPNSVADIADPKLADLKLILDIHTLNFEQINDLWGSLGGKQVPFVLYRARLVRLRRETPLRAAPVIEQVNEESTLD